MTRPDVRGGEPIDEGPRRRCGRSTAARQGPVLSRRACRNGSPGLGRYGHWQRDAEATATLERIKTLVPQVRTVTAVRAEGPVDLVLPGEMQAFTTAAIAARATGYIAERRVDIGSRVKAGELLLRIAAPDLDQQLAQAEAQVGQLRAQLLQAQAQVEQRAPTSTSPTSPITALPRSRCKVGRRGRTPTTPRPVCSVRPRRSPPQRPA